MGDKETAALADELGTDLSWITPAASMRMMVRMAGIARGLNDAELATACAIDGDAFAAIMAGHGTFSAEQQSRLETALSLPEGVLLLPYRNPAAFWDEIMSWRR